MDKAIEVHRGSVQTWECDQMGHLNVQFYVDKAARGLAALAIHLGVPPRGRGEPAATLIVERQHIRFLHEQRPGAPFFVRAGVLEVCPDRLRVVEEMRSASSDAIAATFVSDCRLVDFASRAPLPIAPEVLRRARELGVALPEHAAPRGLEPHEPRPRPRLEEAERLGLFATYQATVEDEQCDAAGWITARHTMGAVADSIPNLLLRLAGVDRSEGGRTGGAALEYRFVHHSVPRAGDVLTLRSGLRAVGAKTYTICHWLFDLASGDAVATAEAVALAMDLETRRAIAIPDEQRRHLLSLVIPGLSL